MFHAAVLTVSDRSFREERPDEGGPLVAELLREAGYAVVKTAVVPDEQSQIETALREIADTGEVQLLVTTGGTGFAPRDVTPEATLAVCQRMVPGIPEAMRYASLRLTPRAMLSRAAAGIRGRTLMGNLPGSEKAARENLLAVLGALGHGVEMLLSAGSADCAAPAAGRTPPSMDQWLREAKACPEAGRIGMYLTHNGVVRETARAAVREGARTEPVRGMRFSCDREKLEAALAETRGMEGVYYVRAWLNEGELKPGEDIMYVLVGGDIRPRVEAALRFLVGKLKGECVREEELFG